MQGNTSLVILVVGAVCVPAIVSALVVFGLSNVRGLKLPRAVLIWLAAVSAVSLVWGVFAGRFQLI